MERKLLLSEDLQNQVKLHHGIDEDPLSFQGFSRSLSVNLCVQICLEGGVTLTAKLHFPPRTASSSVCHWCGRLDSGT